MKVLALLAFFALFFVLVRGQCSVTTAKGDFDLSSLTQDGKDYLGKDAPNTKGKSNIYFVQICTNTVQTCNQNPSPVPSPVCQNDTNGNFHSCGLLSAQSIVAPNVTVSNVFGASVFNSAQFTIIYNGGQTNRASAIVMICDNATTSGGAIKGNVVEPTGSATYYIPFATNAVCPGQSGGGGGGGVVFIIIFFTLLGVYFIGGALFMKFARGASGKEIIPNVEFWADLPSLIKEGVMFLVNKVRGRQEYSTVP